MKGTHLGEFEELVLLTIASLVSEAYSVAICDELSQHAGRTVKLGVVHAVLVQSTIAAGSITGFDLKPAQGMPGVLTIITPENAARLSRPDGRASRMSA